MKLVNCLVTSLTRSIAVSMFTHRWRSTTWTRNAQQVSGSVMQSEEEALPLAELGAQAFSDLRPLPE